MGGVIDYYSSSNAMLEDERVGAVPPLLCICSVMSYTYIIEPLSSGRWYYGSTENLAERLTYHNRGWNRSTKGRGPWKYIFAREFATAEQAREFEFHLKKLRRKEYILKKYSEYFLIHSRTSSPACPDECDDGA